MGSWSGDRLTDPLLIFLQVGFVVLYLMVTQILLRAVWRDWRDRRRVYWQGIGAVVAATVLLVLWLR